MLTEMQGSDSYTKDKTVSEIFSGFQYSSVTDLSYELRLPVTNFFNLRTCYDFGEAVVYEWSGTKKAALQWKAVELKQRKHCLDFLHFNFF